MEKDWVLCKDALPEKLTKRYSSECLVWYPLIPDEDDDKAYGIYVPAMYDFEEKYWEPTQDIDMKGLLPPIAWHPLEPPKGWR